MIVVRVELHSAVTRQVTEIGRMTICNDGTGSVSRGNYEAVVLRRPAFGAATRRAAVRNHARQAEPIWSLIGKALVALGYAR